VADKFQLVGDEQLPFGGYNSCTDKTKVPVNSLIRGSYNVYKKRSGNWANRPGLKKRGSADDESTGIVASYEYKNFYGQERNLRVKDETSEGAGDAKLQVEFDSAWYDLKIFTTLANPALTKTRFGFATWFDSNLDVSTHPFSEFKDRLIMVRGNAKEVLHWSGGISKVGSVATVNATVLTVLLNAAGSGYVAGDELTLVGGNSDAKIVVVAVTAGAITAGYYISSRGSNYAAANGVAVTGGTGTGATFDLTVGTSYNLTKADTTTTWKQDGFADYPEFRTSSIVGYLKAFVGSTEFTYVGGAETTTLNGITVDITGFAANAMVMQSVFVETATDMSEGFKPDFIEGLNNQICYGSYTSRTIHIAALDTTYNSTTSTSDLGFLNCLALSTDLIVGDPDFALLDDVPNGFISRKGSLYVSAGSSDWYEVTPNTIPSVGVPLYHGLATSKTAYVVTKVTKFKGSGRSGLYGHEFIDLYGDNIIYLGQDQQLRAVGTFSNIEGSQFPVLSQEVYEELQEETFTNGHLKIIEDIVYITAPTTGRHWMYQLRSHVSIEGNLSAERTWHPPQVSGISRFAEISGVTYGHSYLNPMIYQIWDTNQWFDDAPDGSSELDYNCVARFAYNNHGARFEYKNFDKWAIEGYRADGTQLYGNVYYEYQGSLDTYAVEVDTDDSPITTTFSGSSASSLGGSALGSNPLGSGPIEESSGQELLPKIKTVIGLPDKEHACTEYALEFLSNTARSRWEIVCHGVNAELAETEADELLKR